MPGDEPGTHAAQPPSARPRPPGMAVVGHRCAPARSGGEGRGARCASCSAVLFVVGSTRSIGTPFAASAGGRVQRSGTGA